MKIIDLLNMISKREEVPKKIKVGNIIWSFDKKEKTYFMNNTNIQLFYVEEITKKLNDEVEIIEEEPYVEICGRWFTKREYDEFVKDEEEKKIHANNIEFNVSYDKRDCVITLDENDLGIDKLHLDNCYFYKENDKWYVKKYDFKKFNLEEKKIPEKIKIEQDTPNSNYYIRNENGTKCALTKHSKMIAETLNEVIDYLDYLKSKGE